ncbi:MAG TPA: hypothetical protein VGN17_15350 [Bryobacteraceae bacterium]
MTQAGTKIGLAALLSGAACGQGITAPETSAPAFVADDVQHGSDTLF